AAIPEAGRRCSRRSRPMCPSLPRLHLVPECLVEDAQIGDVLDHPLGLGIEARDALAGAGVLDVSKPVPDEPSDVELVVEDAGAARSVAVDRGRTPATAMRPGHPFGIELEGDLARRMADGVLLENPVDDVRLRRVDLAGTGGQLAMGVDLTHHVVAVA